MRAISALCMVWLAAAFTAAPATAQDVSEPELKAAFLYNFVRFTDWSEAQVSAGAPLDLCVSDRGVAAALDTMVRGKALADHKLVVKQVNVTGKETRREWRKLGLRSCELLYLRGLGLKASVDVLTKLDETSVLTISDEEEFTKFGGIVRFFLDAGRLRFEISAPSARKARIQFSAKLLQLAQIVKD